MQVPNRGKDGANRVDPSNRDQKEPDRDQNGASLVNPSNRTKGKPDQGLNRATRVDSNNKDRRKPGQGLNGATRVDPSNHGPKGARSRPKQSKVSGSDSRDQSEADRDLDRARRVDPTNRDQSGPPTDRRELIGAKRSVVKEIRAGTRSSSLFIVGTRSRPRRSNERGSEQQGPNRTND